MGKNHRHAKKLKSERNKVHIKSKTKFLPKGQNVTNTAFKIKPIVLQEQLKEREATSLTSRKNVNIEELISKLKHFNETVRTESCQQLKDLISSNTIEAIQVYLAPIFQNLSLLIQDKERKVRRASIKLLHVIFEKIDEAALRPFFTYILTNLKCAMTNINKYIQEDSLLLLDAILETRGALIADHFNEFFPNFLMLISKLKTQDERSLSLNLEGKITSGKWRVKVLTRLYGVLFALIGNQESHDQVENTPTLHSQASVYIPIYKRFNWGNTQLKKNNMNISNLLKLLYDIWLEAVPEKSPKKNSIEVTVLPTEESVAIFTCVVNILKLLEETENVDVFGDVRTASFLDSLITNFPYTHNKKTLEISKDFPKCFLLNHDQNCIEDNLTLIYLFIVLRAKKAKNYPKQKSIATYLNNCLNGHKRLNANSFKILVKILHEILIRNTFLCRKIGANENDLLQSAANFYANDKLPERFRIEILQILTHSKLQHDQSWMEKLPDFLCSKPVSAKLIDAILDLCRKGHETVQLAIKKSLVEILNNLEKLEISDSQNRKMALQNLASIFYYLPNLEDKELEALHDFTAHHPDLEISKYLNNILVHKS